MSYLNISNVGQLIKEAENAYKKNLEKFEIENPTVICTNSGGKDSGATDLLAMAILGEDGYRSVGADTGNESKKTIHHLKTLHEQRGGRAVEIIKAEFTDEEFAVRKDNVVKTWSKKGKVMAGKYRGILMPSLADPNTKFAELWRERMKQLKHPEYETALDAFKANFGRTGNPFLDACQLHGMFPLGRGRFCTDELKIKVMKSKVIDPALENGEVVVWSGTRAEESEKRAGYSRFERDKWDETGDLYNFLPVHEWSASDVFAIYKHFNVKPNPLYTEGMGRVGCMPCVLAAKEEVAEIAARFPEELERVDEWERRVALLSRWWHWMIVGHVQRNQFKKVGNFGNKRVYAKGYKLITEAYTGASMLGQRGGVMNGSVYDVVEWAKTGRGGRVYDLVKQANAQDVCSSKYGLCE